MPLHVLAPVSRERLSINTILIDVCSREAAVVAVRVIGMRVRSSSYRYGTGQISLKYCLPLSPSPPRKYLFFKVYSSCGIFTSSVKDLEGAALMILTDGENYGEYLTVRLPRPVDEALRRRAAESGQSRSELVRSALADRFVPGLGDPAQGVAA